MTPKANPPSPSGSPLRAVGWGAYLACSWTWCIGMFLPILLIRDFGVLGWIVFAVPNVVGAAAMGWVAPSGRDLRGWIDRHRVAIRWFSRVTIGFHLYWTGMLSVGVLPPWSLGLGALLAIVFVFLMAKFPKRTPALSIVVWLVSLALAVWYAIAAQPLDFTPLTANANPMEIMALAPVVVFGFLFCPYLDASFIRARAETNARDAKIAFGVGFGLLFLAMIAFTPVYGAVWSEPGRMLPALIIALVPAHLAMQAAFTTAAHATTIPSKAKGKPAGGLGLDPTTASLALIVTGLGVFAPVLSQYTIPQIGMSAPEIGYRVFMAFYGLVFPAYVWICMIGRDGRMGSGTPTPRAVRVLLGAILLALPFYAIGFIGLIEWWLVPGLAIVLLARLMVTKGPKVAPA